MRGPVKGGEVGPSAAGEDGRLRSGEPAGGGNSSVRPVVSCRTDDVDEGGLPEGGPAGGGDDGLVDAGEIRPVDADGTGPVNAGEAGAVGAGRGAGAGAVDPACPMQGAVAA